MKLSLVYRRAAELIAPEGAWAQGDAVGHWASGGPSCLRTSLARVAHHFVPPAPWACIGEELNWNDAPDTTQADVVTYLLLASEALNSEGR